MNYQNQKRIEIKNFNTITHVKDSSENFLLAIDWKYYEEALKHLVVMLLNFGSIC